MNEPRECDLRRGRLLLSRQLDQRLKEEDVPAQVLALEARQVAAKVPRLESGGSAKRPGEDAPPEWAEGDEADAELTQDRQHARSGSRVQSEYSLWTAATGCTECARRTISSLTSQRPMLACFPH